MYSIHRLKLWNIGKLWKVSDILYMCGKNMAHRYNLHHWDNSRIKSCIIVLICALKNRVYLVYNGSDAIATFQTRKTGQFLLFQKLATMPTAAGKGIGTFCLNQICLIAQNENCSEVVCEVYDQSKHAIDFYLHRGFIKYGESKTVKYREFRLKKELCVHK